MLSQPARRFVRPKTIGKSHGRPAPALSPRVLARFTHSRAMVEGCSRRGTVQRGHIAALASAGQDEGVAKGCPEKRRARVRCHLAGRKGGPHAREARAGRTAPARSSAGRFLPARVLPHLDRRTETEGPYGGPQLAGKRVCPGSSPVCGTGRRSHDSKVTVMPASVQSTRRGYHKQGQPAPDHPRA